MKLYPIKNDVSTLWCGPAALAAITGKPVSEVVATVKRVRGGTRALKGMTNRLMVNSAKAMGVMLETRYPNSPEYLKYGRRPTLAQWLRANRELYAKTPVVVNVTGHYVTVYGRQLIDNQTKKATLLSRAPHKRCRVHALLVVVGTYLPDTVPAAPVPQTIVSGPPLPIVAAIRRIAALHGITLERHALFPGETWVYPPSALDSEELDPHYGDHLAYDWKETHERVRTYARLNTVIPCLAEQ